MIAFQKQHKRLGWRNTKLCRRNIRCFFSLFEIRERFYFEIEGMNNVHIYIYYLQLTE